MKKNDFNMVGLGSCSLFQGILIEEEYLDVAAKPFLENSYFLLAFSLSLWPIFHPIPKVLSIHRLRSPYKLSPSYTISSLPLPLSFYIYPLPVKEKGPRLLRIGGKIKA